MVCHTGLCMHVCVHCVRKRVDPQATGDTLSALGQALPPG